MSVEKSTPKLPFSLKFGKSILEKADEALASGRNLDFSSELQPFENDLILSQVDSSPQSASQPFQIVSMVEENVPETQPGSSFFEDPDPVSFTQLRESVPESQIDSEEGINMGNQIKEKEFSIPSFSKVPPKIVRTSNGKEFQLRPKSKSIFQQQKSSKSYGVDINRIYDAMEARAKAPQKPISKHISGPLWTEKYRPRSFLDLVGNEKANRVAIHWLRQWLQAVFGEELPTEKSTNDKEDPYKDPLGRPQKRILLLHGPPGVGKTTIAHMMTRHLGYDAVEINASDERAGPRVRERIHSALDTTTFLGRPSCVVADEVDGALESGFVRVLTDLVYQDSKATRRLTRREKRAKDSKDRLLLRPIVAICNDLYSPVLERLRPLCEIVQFRKPAESLVKERLEQVCLNEGVKLASKELSQVMAASNMDLRSCLNTLQFNGDAFIEDGREKDLQAPWFRLVEETFRLDLKESRVETMTRLQNRVSGSGAADKIVTGCFHVYPQAAYDDPALLLKASSVGDWMYFHDTMLASKYNMGVDLSGYCEQVPLKYHCLFAEGLLLARKKDVFSNKGWEYHEIERRNAALISRAVGLSLKPSLHCSLARSGYASTEILPLINNYILCPTDTKGKVEHMAAVLKDMGYTIETVTGDLGEHLAIIPTLDSITVFSGSVDLKRQGILRRVIYELERAQIQRTAIKRKAETSEGGKTKEAKNNGTVDFFKASYGSVEGKGETAKPTDLKVWVKYHEGFSNAVRKTVTWESLWD